MKIFFSYADGDSELYNIPKFAKNLQKERFIDYIYYWKRDADAGKSLDEYMVNGILESNAVILFCPTSTELSFPVRFEITLALGKKIPIIPIFMEGNQIPSKINTIRGFIFGNKSYKRFYEDFLQGLTELLLKLTIKNLLIEERITLGYFLIKQTFLRSECNSYNDIEINKIDENVDYDKEIHHQFLRAIFPKNSKITPQQAINNLIEKKLLEDTFDWTGWIPIQFDLNEYNNIGGEIKEIIIQEIQKDLSNETVSQLLYLLHIKKMPMHVILKIYGNKIKPFMYLLSIDYSEIQRLISLDIEKLEKIIEDIVIGIINELTECEKAIISICSKEKIITRKYSNIDYKTLPRNIKKHEDNLKSIVINLKTNLLKVKLNCNKSLEEIEEIYKNLLQKGLLWEKKQGKIIVWWYEIDFFLDIPARL